MISHVNDYIIPAICARAIANTAGAISFYISVRIINRFTAIKVLLAESIMTPAVKIGAVVFITPLSPAIMSFMSILYGASSVSGNALQQKEFTQEQRATMGSLISLGGSIVYAFSALIIGVIADRYGVVVAVVSVQAILLSNVYFYTKVFRTENKA
jgi:hypothetical protein